MNIKELIEREAERRYNPIDGSPNDAVTRAIREVFTAGANFALEMDRWQTGMPDTDGVYMVTDGRDIGIVELFGGGWMHDMLMQIPDDAEITHFQPLPKLPQ